MLPGEGTEEAGQADIELARVSDFRGTGTQGGPACLLLVLG